MYNVHIYIDIYIDIHTYSDLIGQWVMGDDIQWVMIYMYIINYLMSTKHYPHSKIISTNQFHHFSILCVVETQSVILCGNLKTKCSKVFQLSHDLWRDSFLSVVSTGIIHFLEIEREREEKEEEEKTLKLFIIRAYMVL